MIRGIQSFIQTWIQLIHQVFFKPSALRDYLRQIAPELTETPHTGRWYLLHANPDLRRFQLRSLALMVITPGIVNSLVGLSITLAGGDFAWNECFTGMIAGFALSLLLSLTWGLSLGLTWGIAFGMTLGLLWGVTLGLFGGLTAGITGDIVVAVLWGLGVGIAGSLSIALESGLAWGLIGGPLVGIVGGMAGEAVGVLNLNTTTAIAFGVGLLLGVLRVPFYIVEIIPAVRAYVRARKYVKTNNLETDHLNHVAVLSRYVEQSPVYFDDLLMIPQPFLPSLLLFVTRCHLRSGLRHIAYVASNPFQRWAAQRALRTLLEHDDVPFFLIMHELLVAQEPYRAIGGSEYVYCNDQSFITRLVLAEIADVPPVRDFQDDRLSFSDRLAHILTDWLRMRGASPYEPLALAYLYVLTTTVPPSHMFDRVLSLFEASRSQPYGEEMYCTFLAADTALRCQYLAEVAQCRQVIDPLLEIENPLRPDIIRVFRKLNDVTTDATIFLSGEHPVNLRDALLKAQARLEETRKLLKRVYLPEQRILAEILDTWRGLFVTEGELIAEGVEVDVLPNPYVAGRALGPADGKLFVGRQEIFREIETTLHTGVTVVLYGQRRIGKTSILLHLSKHLSHTLLPVYCNLQLLQADTTAGLLYSLTKIVAERLDKFEVQTPVVPSLDTFQIEPFLTFDQFLNDVERSVQLGQRVVLVFDEFEELEKQVTTGHIDERIFTFLRGLTQTRHGIVLLFAGLHTLEQMSYDYWHPFFLSVKPIKVTYLSQSEAWGLITGPIDEFPLKYDKSATDRIIAATQGQPYLIQALCFNLVTYLNNPLHRSNRTSVHHVTMALEQTIVSGSYFFDDYFWAHSNPDEQVTLALVADVSSREPQGDATALAEGEDNGENGSWVDFAVVEKELGRGLALETLKRLCSRDILEEHAEGVHLSYRFQVELLRRWVARTKPLARILLERES